jgi:amidophosphoribosyltransferase
VPRGDGLLSHNLHPIEQGPQDECGVFGVWARGEEVAKLTYFGLYALQHRGQEAAGIAVSDGTGVVVYKDLGLVAQVFDEPTLASLRGHIAVGHTRYSTTGASNWENAQPTLRATQLGPRTTDGRLSATTIALAHNGNLVNTAELAKQVAELGIVDDATSDTALVTNLLAAQPDLSMEAAALGVLPTLRGAFSFVFMDEETLYAARDPQGVRPWCSGASSAAGWWPARPPPWRPSAPASSARWNRASCWRSARTACARPASPTPSPRAVSSSTCTWPGPTA